MKPELPSAPTGSAAPLYLGRFVRRQGQYGTAAVIGLVNGHDVQMIAEPQRLFPREGLVETYGLGHHNGLLPGDWVEFDVVRNTRPRAPEYKAGHLRRVPRYAVLEEATDARYRVLLTAEGWRGDKRPGLWALRISGDRVLVVELAAGKDGALRIPKTAARKVMWWTYDDSLVAHAGAGAGAEFVFLGDPNGSAGALDWSDEADHVARVIRSLSDANDPRVADIITWLELHQEEGRVFAATADPEAAEAALRSGELAARLRADRELMAAYVDAALKNEAVREAVAAYAREGRDAASARLREELARELAEERARLSAEAAASVERERGQALEKLRQEMADLAATQQDELERRRAEADEAHQARLVELNETFDERKTSLQAETADAEAQLTSAKSDLEAALDKLGRTRAEAEAARSQLSETRAEVDRLLAVGGKLAAAPSGAPSGGAALRAFPARPTSDVAAKGVLCSRHALLTDAGKDLLRRFVVLLLSGELPILHGPEAHDFVRLAEALLCPGRFALVEADPTLISVDDLLSRPGSGAPTAIASAAAAAEQGGAVLVVINGIERSGARFWAPALAEALRGGAFARGLFICCLVDDLEHDEIAALPPDLPWLEVSEAILPSAYLGAPAFLSSPNLDLTALNPGPAPSDLSAGCPILVEVPTAPSLRQAMRIARMFAEAKALTGDDAEARRIVLDLADSTMRDRG